MASPTIFLAFVAGLISFISPCILPLIPGFMAYISAGTGTGPGPEAGPSRARTFVSSIFFVLGFAAVFALLGVLLNTVLSRVSYAVQTWLSRIAGLVIIFFAFHILGLINIPFLQSEHRIRVAGVAGAVDKKLDAAAYLTAFAFGASFAVGWSPCVGAILGSIFAIAISTPGLAFALLLAYSLGLGIPFLIVGLFTKEAMGFIGRSQSILRYFSIVVGILLVAVGVLVFTDNLNLVASFIVPPSWFGS